MKHDRPEAYQARALRKALLVSVISDLRTLGKSARTIATLVGYSPALITRIMRDHNIDSARNLDQEIAQLPQELRVRILTIRRKRNNL